MRDLKIKPGMDTPKAKLKNPAPKDADSILKKHMDKRQREKEPESHDPVRYATDRVEKNMRRGASGAADASRRMIKQSCGRAKKMRRGSTEWQIWGLVRKAALPMPRRNMTFLQHNPLHEMKSETGPFLRKIAEVQKAQMPPRRSVGGRKLRRTRKPPIGGTLPRKEQQKALLRLHGQTVEA